MAKSKARIEIQENLGGNFTWYLYNERDEIFESFGPFTEGGCRESIAEMKRLMAEAEIEEGG